MRTPMPLRGLLASAALLMLEMGCTIEIYYQEPAIAPCGNSVADPGEQCDDGDTASGDGCSSTCLVEVCGNGILDPGEACDDGNRASGDGCSSDCSSSSECGNGAADAGEECDTSGASAGCDPDCTFVSCGDGIWNAAAGEECDTVTNTATCNAILCTLSVCGDGFFNLTAGEECDTIGETVACDVDCTTRACGDGYRNTVAGEECDDGNATCGTCSANCMTFASARAAGSIAVVKANDLDEIADTFTLDDGIHPPVTFELTLDGTVDLGSVPVLVLPGMSATAVRDHVRDEINNVESNSGGTITLWITAAIAGSSFIGLTHDLFTSTGNIAITETVTNPSFVVTGMSGGAGGDCASGQSCRFNEDCQSNVCQLNVCQ